jgi:dipeptidyl aminopeptidase/acylaminoacyl peptidase
MIVNKDLPWLAVAAIFACIASATARGSNQLPRAEVFAGLPGVLNVAISPNGQILASDRYSPSGTSIEVYDASTGVVRRTIDLGTVNKLRALNWATDHVLLVEVSATHTFGESASKLRAYEWQRTVAIDIDGGSVRKMLLDDTGNTWVTGSTLYATRTGRPDIVTMATMAHSVARQSGIVDTRLSDARRDTGWAYTLYDVSSRTGKGKATAIGTQYTRDWAIDRQGLAVARSEWNADSGEFTILAGGGAAWREIYKRTDGEQLKLSGLSPDGRSVLAVGHNGGSHSKVWAIALDGSGTTVFFEDAEDDVEAIETDLTNGAPIGAYIGGLNARLHFFDPKMLSRQTALAKAFPGRRVKLLDRSHDSKRVIVKVDSPMHPAVFYLVDFATGKADTAGESYPGLAGVALGEVRFSSYSARDGVEIPAFLTLPPGRGEKNLPLIVLPHGGPHVHDTADFNWWAQFLATRGYAVLQPQFRGSTGYGTAHRQAGYGQWGGLMQDDVSDGVKAMIESGLADPAKICIAGASYGGYAALAGAAFTPDLYACAISVNGISDLPAMLGHLKKRAETDFSDSFSLMQDQIGPSYASAVIAKSPARAVENIKAPILLLHGSDDTVVPISQAEAMDRALTEAGKPHTLVKLPGEDHWLSRSATRTQVLEEIERFLARYLGPTAP